MNDQRIAALRAMAAADESPHEAEIAKTKLAEAGIPIEPPRPPAPPAAPAPMPMGFGWTSTTGTSSTSWTTLNIWVSFHG